MDFLIDEDRAEGYSMKYPEDWNVVYRKQGAIAHYLSPQEGRTDSFRENVSLFKSKPLPVALLDDYVDLQVNQLRNSMLDFQLVKRKNMKLDGRKAQQIVFKGNQENMAFQFMQIYAADDKGVYSICFVSEQDVYDDYKKILKKMVRSFKIL